MRANRLAKNHYQHIINSLFYILVALDTKSEKCDSLSTFEEHIFRGKN